MADRKKNVSEKRPDKETLDDAVLDKVSGGDREERDELLKQENINYMRRRSGTDRKDREQTPPRPL